MITSNFIYGTAANNMHGDLNEAIEANVLTEKEVSAYLSISSCIMNGKIYKDEYPELIQFKLDEFFKRDVLDYEDFSRKCKELSGDKDVTVCNPDLFGSGRRCYYTNDGKTIEVSFVSRFEKKELRPHARTLTEYIGEEFNGSQKSFASAQKVQPPQVTQWLDKKFIVVNDVLYSERRELVK